MSCKMMIFTSFSDYLSELVASYKSVPQGEEVLFLLFRNLLHDGFLSFLLETVLEDDDV